jgi:DNA repair exonuclease SbcCD ATPase subunit
MRKLMVAVAAVAGLALSAGCKRSPQEERRELAEAQKDAQNKIAEAHKDANEERADISRDANEERVDISRDEQEEIAEAQGDMAEEQRDVAKADQERAEELRHDNADTMAASDTVQGRVRSTTGDSLVLVVPGRNDSEMKLKTDDKTRVTQNSREVDLDDFKEGTEVRASYVTDGDDLVARDVVIIAPVQKK